MNKTIIKYLLISFLYVAPAFARLPNKNKHLLGHLNSVILFKGDEQTAYRDPAILFHHKTFYLFFTLIKIENDGKIYSYTAMSHSKDLIAWTAIKILTPKNQNLDFSSPGNVIRYKNEWILCLQTYPRPDYTAAQMPRYASKDARIFTMRSKDLNNWTDPEIIKVKGPDTTIEQMGRMIDPYLLKDKEEKNKWWCFYKQNGASLSFTYDFKNWTYFGHTKSGENACVLIDKNEYVLMHSLENGMAIKRSSDLKNWYNWGDSITLGQKEWPWAKGRITGGAVVDLRNTKNIAKYVMFFHGSGPLTETQGDFDKNASIGIAWSNDLIHWDWPKNKPIK